MVTVQRQSVFTDDVAHLRQFPFPCCLSRENRFAAAGLKGSEPADRPAEEQSAPTGEPSPSQDHDLSLSEAADLTANTVPNGRNANAASLHCHADVEKPKYCSPAFFNTILRIDIVSKMLLCCHRLRRV